jgi:hypothetical protein
VVGNSRPAGRPTCPLFWKGNRMAFFNLGLIEIVILGIMAMASMVVVLVVVFVAGGSGKNKDD